jgi:3-phosphoshikimate 1-carboxyvinyltransferase
MSNLSLSPRTKTINSSLDLPGSKSIANRVLLLAAVAHGTSIIHNVPDVSEDVVLMLEALKHLGVKITKLPIKSNASSTSSYQIDGCDGEFSVKNATIFCGNSGTSIRFLLATLALMPGSYILTGIERMKERPIKDLVLALNQVGAKIDYMENQGYPPLQTHPFVNNQQSTIASGAWQASPINIENQNYIGKANLELGVRLSGQMSSQYLTGLLMALPLLQSDITVHIYDELISKPYVDITIALLAKFGCKIENNGNDYYIRAGSKLTGIEYTVEPDASSASYFLAMGALNGNIKVNNLSEHSLQGDKKFAYVLQQMGAKVEYQTNAIIVQHQGKLRAIDIDMQEMPDVAMTIAILVLFADGMSCIRGISSWKVKETDRLQAIYNELTKLGAVVTMTNDSITITPPDKIKHNIAINTYNDHRMAMCFSLVAVADVPVTINDYECVGKTFANYFEVFNSLCYGSA